MKETQSTEKQKTGQLGEDIACEYLVKHDFQVVERNYRKKWGEIDIVAKKKNNLHFIEVKAVSHSLIIPKTGNNVAHETYQPEENIHPWKIKRLHRAIQTYLLDKHVRDDQEWQIDALAVFLDFKTRKAQFRFTENIF